MGKKGFSFILFMWCMIDGQVGLSQTLAGVTMDRTIEQFGKLHPMILHFPIVFISLAPLVIVLSLFSFGRIWIPTIPYFVHLGTLSALGTVALGFAAASHFGGGSELPAMLLWHRNLTVVAAALMVTLSLYLLIKKPDLAVKIPLGMLGVSLLAALVLTAGAHLGAETVHGKTFILFDAPEAADDYR